MVVVEKHIQDFSYYDLASSLSPDVPVILVQTKGKKSTFSEKYLLAILSPPQLLAPNTLPVPNK